MLMTTNTLQQLKFKTYVNSCIWVTVKQTDMYLPSLDHILFFVQGC